MEKGIYRGLCIVFFAIALLSSWAQAALDIVITQGVKGATPIAVVPFEWRGSQNKAPEDLATIISDDLGRSGRFAPLR